MTNKSNASKNFIDSMMDSQNQALETLVENTKKFTNGNSFVNETIDKGADFYKKTMNSGRETWTKMTEQGNQFQNEMKNGSDAMNTYLNNWKEQQAAWSNQLTEMNKQFLTNWMNPANSQQFFQQAQTNWMNMFNQNNMQNMMSDMMNPSNWQQNMTKANDQVTAFWNQLQQVMTDNYNQFAKNFSNGTIQDSFKGMVNMTDGFAKFYEMWMPMMKSMNEKTFNMDMFKNMLNMDQYKAFMDKYFSFMPQNNMDYFNQMKSMFTEAFKNNNNMTNDMMNNMRSTMNNMFPMMAGNPFTAMLSNYNQFYGQMMSAVSPFAKLMGSNNDTKTMTEWADIINNMNVYQIKNSEMQYMVYQTGMNVMNKIAENTMHKIENGEEVNSMMKLYQEWLNLSDAEYVKLFETDEYSALMAEVSAMQLRLKKDIEKQMEKAFVNVPVATRSEMDELYKTIYDLKKELRAFTHGTKKETPVAKPAAVRNTTTKKAAKPVVTKKTTKRK
ncbi:MAG: hypothetical protein JNM95_14880 [Chitinophagaceae bacterium]|nr:hypothetical protein [Chitinophagaceae bacterium]